MFVSVQSQPAAFWNVRTLHAHDGVGPIVETFGSEEAAYAYVADRAGDFIVKRVDFFIRCIPDEEPETP